MDTAPLTMRENTIPCDQWETPFSDRFGHFSVDFSTDGDALSRIYRFSPESPWKLAPGETHSVAFVSRDRMKNVTDDTSDVAADRIISHLTHVRGFLENMTTDPADTEPSGFNDYTWGSAMFCLVAERRCRL